MHALRPPSVNIDQYLEDAARAKHALEASGHRSSPSPWQVVTAGGATDLRASPVNYPSHAGRHRRLRDRIVTPDHHVVDFLARLGPVKALRFASPPLRGAGGLDRASVEPWTGPYVMVGDV